MNPFPGYSAARLRDYTFADSVGSTALAQRSDEVSPARIRLQLCNVAGGNRDYPALPHLHNLHGPGGK